MIITVISGKGGTGKTTVAVNLALSAGSEFTLADCDVEGPNADLFLSVRYHSSRAFTVKTPVIDRVRCTLCGECSSFCAYNALALLQDRVLVFPDLCHSCLGCALLCPENAISFRDRPAGKIERGEVPRDGRNAPLHFIRGEALVAEHRGKFLIRKVKEQVPGKGDVIIDAPPGTVLAAEAMRGADRVLIVAEPTPFGLSDLARVLALSRAMALTAGVVINKSCSSDPLVVDFCVAREVPLLGTIPLDREIAEAYARGMPISSLHERYRHLFEDMLSRLSCSEGEHTHQGESL